MLVSMLVINQQVNCWVEGPYDDHIKHGFKPPGWKFPFGHGYDANIFGDYEGHWRSPIKFDVRQFDNYFQLLPPSEYSDYKKYAKKVKPNDHVVDLPLQPRKVHKKEPVETKHPSVNSPQVPKLPPPIYYDSVVNFVPKSSSVSS